MELQLLFLNKLSSSLKRVSVNFPSEFSPGKDVRIILPEKDFESIIQTLSK